VKQWDKERRLYFPKAQMGAWRIKRFLDELKGMPRIINASSNDGNIAPDPFCGCGATIHAA
jgi:hypothetical protein